MINKDSVPISNNRNLMEWLVNCQTKSLGNEKEIIQFLEELYLLINK